METKLTHAIDGFEIPVTDTARARSSTKRDPAPRKALPHLSRDLLTLRPFLAGRTARPARLHSYDRGAFRPALPMTAAAKPRSPNDATGLWRTVSLILSLPVVLGALLWGASALSDGNRIPGLLALAAKESGVMYCTEGEIVHGNGSLVDRAVEEGTFRCTAWKLRGEQTDTVKGATPWPTSPRR